MASIGHDTQRAANLLARGELVAIPTETVYGLAGNALDQNAVSKIFEVKDRPFFDPLIVHISSWLEVGRYATDIPGSAKLLTDRFWPGPLTLLLKKKENIPDLVTAGLDRVGLRCPQHALTLSLLKNLSFPLAAPSANPFGYVSPTTAQHVENQLGKKITYILDGGPCEVGIESTVIGWENEIPVLYRLGGISLEEIESVVGTVKVLAHSTSQPQSPGQITSHYAPEKRLVLGNLTELIKAHRGEKVGILSFKKKFESVSSESQLILSPSGDLREAAQKLFASLRQFESMNVDVILAEEVPNEGLGKAINDRLRRAAAKG